jgi:hypothetical protein
MKYDFIEIGTSNFDTLIQAADDFAVGISIEPIKYYLDSLPGRANVKKLNVAVSKTDCAGQLDVYFVPESVIVANQLPAWLRGCNAVGEYHFQHTELGITDLVVKQSVPVVPIADIFNTNDVTELDYLKIDTEGSDCAIMEQLYRFLRLEPRSRWPRRILFESNELAVPAEVEQTKFNFVVMGYQVVQTGYDTVLEYK